MSRLFTIAESAICVGPANPEDAKGKWHEIFGMIIQSISKWGVEKGPYYWMAKANPEINYWNWIFKIGLELCLDKVLEADVQH